MNSIGYDAPRTDEMQAFLDHLYTIYTNNPGYAFSDNYVYAELERYGLRSYDIDSNNRKANVRGFFQTWFSEFGSGLLGTRAFCDPNWRYWAQFVRDGDKIRSPYIKLYIPIDSAHLKEGVIKLFNYIDSIGVRHQSKVGEQVRSDNVIVRLSSYDMESAIKIINYINQDPYLKEGLNKVNPFIPTMGGIGVMVDYGNSYNSAIAELLNNYINRTIKAGKKPDINEFYSNDIINAKVVQRGQDVSNMIKYVFMLASGFKKPVVENNNGLSEYQKQQLFLDAVKATYNKYGLEQVSAAIMAIIDDNDYEYITNGDTSYLYREQLEQNVTSKDVLGYVSQMVLRYNPNFNDRSTAGFVNQFISIMFMDDVILKFQDICSVTLENHGRDWLHDALLMLFERNGIGGFSRYLGTDKTINYRAELSKMSKEECIRAMEAQLIYSGIDYSGCEMEEVISLYVNSLSSSLYESVSNTAKSKF